MICFLETDLTEEDPGFIRLPARGLCARAVCFQSTHYQTGLHENLHHFTYVQLYPC